MSKEIQVSIGQKDPVDLRIVQIQSDKAEVTRDGEVVARIDFGEEYVPKAFLTQETIKELRVAGQFTLGATKCMLDEALLMVGDLDIPVRNSTTGKNTFMLPKEMMAKIVD